MAEWWENIEFTEPEVIEEWFFRSFLGAACASGETIHRLDDFCRVDMDALVNVVTSVGNCRPVVDNVDRVERDGSSALVAVEWVYASSRSLVVLRSWRPGEVRCRLASSDGAFAEALRSLLHEKGSPAPTPGEVFVITKSRNNEYELSELGTIRAPLERGNYAGDVLAAFDHVRRDLGHKDPCGRLVVIDGEPGSGKSFLIKGLVSEVEAMFVFVPSSIVSSLSGPELMPVLLRERCRCSTIVLILEDADASLIPRGMDNLDRISDLLNAGDGILGELADLRIIATTNSDRIELDKALLRPGRLCAQIHVGALGREQAAQVYHRLTGKTVEYREPKLLAEIYGEVRRDGTYKTHAMERIGFTVIDSAPAC